MTTPTPEKKTDTPKTVVLTTPGSLSAAADAILDKAAACAEAGVPLSKNAVLNAVAAQICGPKHNWGFVKSRTGLIRDRRLPAGAEPTEPSSRSTTAPDDRNTIAPAGDGALPGASRAPGLETAGPDSLPLARIHATPGNPRLQLLDRGHSPHTPDTPATIEIALTEDIIDALRAALAGTRPWPVEMDGLVVTTTDHQIEPAEDWLTVFHRDSTTNLLRQASLAAALAADEPPRA